jgi:hypothetical protein
LIEIHNLDNDKSGGADALIITGQIAAFDGIGLSGLI